MTFNEYQEAARRTQNPDVRGWIASIEAAMGIGGEAGEVIDLIKKAQFQGHEPDVLALESELGDLLWYISEMADYLGVSLDAIAEGNIEKLRIRYPDGFTELASRNRKESEG